MDDPSDESRPNPGRGVPQSTACRLMVIVDEDAVYGHRPLYTEIVRRAHDAGLWGASVFRGIEGFGATGRVHTSRILDLSDSLPAMIVIVDRRESIAAFVPQLREIGVRGVMAIDEVELPFGPPKGAAG